MKKSILLGIDLGTTVLKICAFDARNGTMLAHAARRLPVESFPNGGREQSPAAIDRAFKASINELKVHLQNNWQSVVGIGLAAQGGSSLFADRVTGKPHSSMILWNDGRAQKTIALLASQYPINFWRKQLLYDVPPHGLGRLLWLKETKPDLFREDLIHIGVGEYLYFKLTSVWRQDAGNAIQIGSYNPKHKRLEPSLLNLINVPLSLVAPLRPGHETSPLTKSGARILDLPKDIPVAGPYIDQEAGYLSAVGTTARPLQCSLGTAWVGNFTLPDDTNGSSPFQLVIPSPVSQGRLVIQPLMTGNSAWEWGLTHLLDPNPQKALPEAEKIFSQSLLPLKGLMALPWFAQMNPLFPEAYGGGTFFGISTQTDSTDLLRALAASMAFELARVFNETKQTGAIDGLVLGGGAAKGTFFRTLIAGLFAPLPVFWQTDEDLSVTRGSVYAFNSKTARCRTQKVPIPADALIDEILNRYTSYLALFEKLYSMVHAGKAFQFGKRKP